MVVAWRRGLMMHRVWGKKIVKARGIDVGLTPPQKARTLKSCVCDSITGDVWTLIGMGRQGLVSCQLVAGRKVFGRLAPGSVDQV